MTPRPFYIRWLCALQDYLDLYTAPPPDEMVSALVMHTASLEMTKDDWVELAPMKGCCGPFKLTGTSLPVVEYKVFEKKMMEFIKVRVEIARPNKITYLCTIDATGTQDQSRHGEEVAAEYRYRAPFMKLSLHLYAYFPFIRNPSVHYKDAPRLIREPKPIVSELKLWESMPSEESQ